MRRLCARETFYSIACSDLVESCIDRVPEFYVGFIIAGHLDLCVVKAIYTIDEKTAARRTNTNTALCHLQPLNLRSSGNKRYCPGYIQLSLMIRKLLAWDSCPMISCSFPHGQLRRDSRVLLSLSHESSRRVTIMLNRLPVTMRLA